MNKPKNMYTGIGLVLGCGFGYILSLIMGHIYYVGVGVTVGLLVGGYLDMRDTGTKNGSESSGGSTGPQG